jgi:hypothetical protein
MAFALPSMADTVLWFQGTASRFWPQNEQVRELRAPAWSFEQVPTGGASVQFFLKDAASGSLLSLAMAPRVGESIHEGPYEEAVPLGPAGASPVLSFSFLGGCTETEGRFVVLESGYASDGSIDRLAVDFQQRCDDGASIFGEFRFNSSVALTHANPGPTPEAFELQTRSPVQAGALVRSNSFIVYGVTTDVPVSVTGGQYSVNGGRFTSAPGFVQDRDRLVVQTQAPFAPGASSLATINVGGRTATLTAETYQPGTALTGLFYASPTGDWVGQGTTRWYLSPRDIVEAGRNYRSGVSVSVLGVGGSHMALDLASATSSVLSPGSYESATRFATTSGVPGIDFHGDGRGCNTITGRFVVREAVYASDGAIERFAADFEQSCEATGPPLLGELRINSAVPFTALSGVACGPGDADGDGAPDCTEVGVGMDPNVKDNDVFRDASLFSAQQYRDFLGREGDSIGIAFWAGQINSLSRTHAQVIESLMASPEFQDTTASVIRLYLAYFTRYPDEGGLRFWSSFRRSGHSLDEISGLFAASGEFAQRYGALSNADFVSLVYANVLGRSADPGGFAFWQGQLDSGAMSRGTVMLQFSESAEFQSLAQNEVFATMLYLGTLRRAPDPGGFAFWVQQLDAGVPRESVIDTFIRSGEYRARFLP